MITCSSCEYPQSEIEFSPSRRLRKYPTCRKCETSASRLYRAANPDKQSDMRRRYRLRTPDQQRHSHRKQVLRRYGLSVERYESLLKGCNGLCEICSMSQTAINLAVDHDHITGVVRGLLCGNCNRAIGIFQDSPELLERAAAYLRSRKEGVLSAHQQ